MRPRVRLFSSQVKLFSNQVGLFSSSFKLISMFPALDLHHKARSNWKEINVQYFPPWIAITWVPNRADKVCHAYLVTDQLNLISIYFLFESCFCKLSTNSISVADFATNSQRVSINYTPILTQLLLTFINLVTISA